MTMRRTMLAILIVLISVPVATFAQVLAGPDFTPVGISAIPFNFGPPGARSLGMGGAFIGIADDATASEANPAGLTILTRPEVSIHGRYSAYDLQTFDESAALSLGILNNNRVNNGAAPLGINDSIGNAFTGNPFPTFDDTTTDVSFASWVQPFSSWVLSLYYQQSTSFSGSSSFQAYDDLFVDVFNSSRFLDTNLESVGVSAGFLLTENVSFGVSVRQSRLKVKATEMWQVKFFNDLEFAPALGLPSGTSIGDLENFANQTPLSDVYESTTTFDDNDSDVTFNAGLLFNPNGKLSFGLVYKTGGTYNLSGTVVDSLRVNAPILDINNYEDITSGAVASELTIPDFAGAGFAWRPTDQLMVSFDADFVTYSDLDSGQLDDPNLPATLRAQLEPVDDQWEYHLGIEYTFFPGQRNLPFSIRAGAWSDQDHDGVRAVDSDQIHATVGFGAVLTEGFQLDVAAHFADTVNEGLLSLVYRF